MDVLVCYMYVILYIMCNNVKLTARKFTMLLDYFISAVERQKCPLAIYRVTCIIVLRHPGWWMETRGGSGGKRCLGLRSRRRSYKIQWTDLQIKFSVMKRVTIANVQERQINDKTNLN